VGKSGTELQGRIGLQELIALAATRPLPFEYISRVSTDRLSRNLSDMSSIQEAFARNGVMLHFAANGLDPTEPHPSCVSKNHMKRAVSYARVSTQESEQNFSLESQVKTARGYAASKGFNIVKEFTFSESAKKQRRKHFNAMLDYLRQHPDVRIVIVEKTDRLSRNLADFVLVESIVEVLGLKVHLVKEGQVLRRESKSQDRLLQRMFLLFLDRHYIQNLQENMLKGQIEKASRGIYPSMAPFGYRNNSATHTIEVHPEKSKIVKRVFELFASGRYSLLALSKEIRRLTGTRLCKAALHYILGNTFYIGMFDWSGQTYKGTHECFINPEHFEKAQSILHGR